MARAIDVLGRTGINVTRSGEDSLDRVVELGADGIRIPVTIADEGPPHVRYDLRGYLRDAKARGLKVLLVLDRDAFYWPDWRHDTEKYVQWWTEFYSGLFDGIQVGNEWDHVSPSSWDLAPSDFSDLLRAVRAAVGPGVFLVSGGMADGQPEAAKAVDAWDQVDAFGFHPYLKDAPNPDDLEDVPDVDVLHQGYIDAIQEASGLALEGVMSEWGWPGEWGEPRQSEESAEMVLWAARRGIPLQLFNLRDSTESFGLLRQDGSKKAAFNGVQWAIDNRPPLDVKPVEPPKPVDRLRPWRYWNADQMAEILDVPLDNILFLWPKLVEQMLHWGIEDELSWIAMACTVRIETGGPTRALRFTCVREAYWMTEEWRKANLRYYPWYGRGPIQCTLEGNYNTYAKYIDDMWKAGGAIIAAVKANLDTMLDPDIGSAFSAAYFANHGGKGLYKICVAARAQNWTEVRRLVQGADAGLPDLILYANKFLRLSEKPVEPKPGVDYSKYRFPVMGYRGPVNLHWGQDVGIGGTDIFAARGTDVVAITDGTVVYRAAWSPMGGNAIQLEHDHDGLESYYAHGDQTPLVADGQHVTAGTKLFGVGDTGNATGTGPHLHFGMGKDIRSGSGVLSGTGTDFNAVEFLRELQKFEVLSPEPVEPPHPCADLISTVGYLGGDIPRRLDAEILSQMPIPPLEPKASKRTKAYWEARAKALEKEIHEAYRDGTAIKDEIIRAAQEALT